MTIGGVVNKTALSLVLVLVAASITWNLGPTDPRVNIAVLGGALGGFVIAMATVFRPQWAPITTPLVSALRGRLRYSPMVRELQLMWPASMASVCTWMSSSITNSSSIPSSFR